MAQGIGGMGNLLKQAQEMQARLAKVQEELAHKTVEGSAGGGMVQVT
ncbi:MAG: YbaB/EbfC family nucleoid-associated protein, partial [Candidatus Binatia bacterium]